jgi:hypothetical protein
MRDKLNQFVANLNGQWVEVSDQSNKAQCMDLVYNWVFALGFPKSTIQHLYAYEAYTLASDFTRTYFDVIPNLTETIPQEGDIVVWNKTSGNIAGHIAIVIEATQTKMKVFEQNKPLGSNSHIADESYTNCLGFLRPRHEETPGIPAFLKTLAQEAGLDINNESQFRAFWEKAKKYDEDTKTLRGQLVSVNEALAEKSTELANEIDKVDDLKRTIDQLQEKLNQVGSAKDTAISEATKFELLCKTYNQENIDLISQNKQLQAKVDELIKTSIEGLGWRELMSLAFKRMWIAKRG